MQNQMLHHQICPVPRTDSKQSKAVICLFKKISVIIRFTFTITSHRFYPQCPDKVHLQLSHALRIKKNITIETNNQRNHETPRISHGAYNLFKTLIVLQSLHIKLPFNKESPAQARIHTLPKLTKTSIQKQNTFPLNHIKPKVKTGNKLYFLPLKRKEPKSNINRQEKDLHL